MTDKSLPVIGFIFARGGSKGVPRKNIRPLGGIPLIGHAIRAALSVPRISRLIVSTDDAEIARIARAFGAETPFERPTSLASDGASELDAWRHALDWLTGSAGSNAIGTFVSVPATAPLRNPKDIDRCIDALHANSESDIVITVTEARANPYFNMVRFDTDHSVKLAIDAGPMPVRRQEAPKFYEITPIAYAATPDYVRRATRVFDGKVGAIVVDPNTAVDIDTEQDWKFAEFLYAEREAARQR